MNFSSTPSAAGPTVSGLTCAVALHGDEEAGLGRAIELLQVDAEGAEERHQSGSGSVAGGEGHAHIAHPEDVAQRTANQEVARGRDQAVAQGDRLAARSMRWATAMPARYRR